MEIFFKTNGTGEKYNSVPTSDIESLKSVFPEFLIQKWNDTGLTHHLDGFFWFTNPLNYKDVVSLFFPQKTGIHIFMRTALGGFLYLNENASKDEYSGSDKLYNYYSPMHKKSHAYNDDLSLVLNGFLTIEDIFARRMLYFLYKNARQRLKIPKEDECYGFFPALAIGGEENSDNLKLCNLKAHLLILSQL